MLDREQLIHKLNNKFKQFISLGGKVDKDFKTSSFYNYTLDQIYLELKNIEAVIDTIEKSRALGKGLGFDFYIRERKGVALNRQGKINQVSLGTMIEIEDAYKDLVIRIPNTWNNVSIVKSLTNIIQFSWEPEIELHVKSKEQLIINEKIINSAIGTGNLKLYINGTKVRQL